jgi:hypothetical protein
VSTTRKSAVNSYRLVWGLWIALSLVYTAGYWHLAVLSGRTLQGCVLASAFLIQALLVPTYIWREQFSSGVGAAIQAASAAVSIVGIPAIFLALTESSFRPAGLNLHYFNFAYTTTYGLQFGYVTTILVLSGIAGGTSLGVLRRRMLQTEAAEAISKRKSEQNPGLNQRPDRSRWDRYLRSAMPWAASATLCSWLIEAFVWATRSAPGTWASYENELPAEVLLGIGGLLFIAPMPLLSRAPEAGSRGRRIRRYFLLAMRPVAIFAAVMAVPWVLWALGVFMGYCIILAVPCLLWAVLYEHSGPSPTESAQPSANELSRYPPKRGGISNTRVVWLAAGGQACALFAGMLATAPVSLNVHGVGCLAIDQGMSANVYWFWKAYKGLGSEVHTGKKMILRPSVDRSTCLILNESAMDGMDEPKEITKGYVGAARIWAWLIDPEQWDSERSKQIRRELTRLLGRDFSSYDELEAWWKNNGEYLAWSGTDELLEVRRPEYDVRPEPPDNYLRRPYVLVPFADKKFEVPEFFGPDPFGVSKLPLDGYQRSSWDEFRVYDDPEARSRGLKLDAAGSIQIMTGEQQRRIQEYLHNMIGGDFSTYDEWRNFFAQSPRQNPWNVKRKEVTGWIDLLQGDRSIPAKEETQIRMLQAKTGLSYSNADDFIQWLRNPENTRYEEWEKASTVFAVYDDPELHRSKSASIWLKMITDQDFDSPEEWVRWWQANRSNLILSEDGLKLISKRK